MSARPTLAAMICLAFAFAVAACGGGGGAPAKPTASAPVDPAPTPAPMERDSGGMERDTNGPPPAPSAAGDRSKFFPLRQLRDGTGNDASAEGHITFSRNEHTDGKGTVTVVVDTWIPRAFVEFEHLVNLPDAPQLAVTRFEAPEFSDFTFGEPTNANGIDLQRATKVQAGKYAAIAYQAILEHSMFIFQGGIYKHKSVAPTSNTPYPDFNLDGGYYGAIAMAVGDRAPYHGPVTGTWKGKAVGIETHDSREINSPYPYTLSEAERAIMTANVLLEATAGGTSDRGIMLEFSGLKGGTEGKHLSSYQLWGKMPSLDSFYETINLHERPLDHGEGSAAMHFYGPKGGEAVGKFSLNNRDSRFGFAGGFAAKKQRAGLQQ